SQFPVDVEPPRVPPRLVDSMPQRFPISRVGIGRSRKTVVIDPGIDHSPILNGLVVLADLLYNRLFSYRIRVAGNQHPAPGVRSSTALHRLEHRRTRVRVNPKPDLGTRLETR